MGQLLGYIPRATATQLSAAMEARCGSVLEGVGFIVGGWDDGDSIGSYGVRVWIGKEALNRIGVNPSAVQRDPYTRSGSASTSLHGASSDLDTGFSNAWETDDDDDSYDLSWYEQLPEADRPAIEMLRKLLATEADPFDRHFQYSVLEHRLYRCRTLYDSALDEYDTTCVAHDAEMATMRAVFLGKWGKVPRLDLYRQMAIRQSKAHDWNAALWWSERGLAVYGEDAAREAAVEDLMKRRIQALAKLNPPPVQPRTPAATTSGLAAPSLEDLDCKSCGATFQRVKVKGRKPHLCPDCRTRRD
jgi:hypothetical protein